MLVGQTRQIDLDARSVPGLAIDFYVAAGLFDKAINHAETEAGSFARRLGREKRIEGSLDNLLGHAGSGIRHRNHDILPRRDLLVPIGVSLIEMGIGALDREFSALRHRIAPVDDQVQQGHFQLVGVATRAPQSAGQHGLDRDLRSERAAGQVGHGSDQPVDVDRRRRERLLPRESEQPLGQGRGPLGAAQRLGEARRDVGGLPFHASLHRLDIADDHGEQVVEIVRDAAGKLPDRLHFLALAGNGLGFLPLDDFTPQLLVYLRQLLRPVRDAALQIEQQLALAPPCLAQALHRAVEAMNGQAEKQRHRREQGERKAAGLLPIEPVPKHLQRSQPDQEQRERRRKNARGKPSQNRRAENRREECNKRHADERRSERDANGVCGADHQRRRRIRLIRAERQCRLPGDDPFEPGHPPPAVCR